METRETTQAEKLVIALGYDPDSFFDSIEKIGTDDLQECLNILTSEPDEDACIEMLAQAGAHAVRELLKRRSVDCGS